MVRNLRMGTAYTFRVEALNRVGTSVMSFSSMAVTTRSRHKGNFTCRACAHRYNNLCPQHLLRWSCCSGAEASSVFCESILKSDPKPSKRFDSSKRKPWVTPYQGVDEHVKKRQSKTRTLPGDKSGRSFNRRQPAKIHPSDKNRQEIKAKRVEAEYWEKLAIAHADESGKWDR